MNTKTPRSFRVVSGLTTSNKELRNRAFATSTMKIRSVITAFLCFSAAMSFAQENEINEMGNVGIGTITPTHKLEVKGDVKIDSTLLVRDSLAVSRGAGIEGDLTVAGNTYLNSNAAVVQDFRVGGATQLQNTTLLGSVTLSSLGTATGLDNHQLMVHDANGLVKSIGVASLGNLLYNFSCNTVNGVVQSPTWANGPNKLYVACPEVFVGIGTATPLYSLDVRGRGYLASGIQLGNPNTSGTPALIEGRQLPNASGPLMRLSVNNNGVPETRFRVENDGTVYCTAVKVRPTAAIPDYVFRPTYRLMPLDELRVFVTENSHLPNVPSEADIHRDGLSLEEMQLRLLEKIEELTLYVLQLDDASKAMQQQQNQLQQEVQALKTQTH